WDETGSEEAMSSRRLAVRAALFATIALAGLLAAGPTDFGSPRNEIARTPAIEDSGAKPASTAAEPIAITQIAKNEDEVAHADSAIPDTAPVPATAPILDAALPVPASASDTPSFQLASLSPPDQVPGPVKEALSPAKTVQKCVDADMNCVNQYLWSMYERAPKLDTVKVSQTVKVTVTKKGKTRTISK